MDATGVGGNIGSDGGVRADHLRFEQLVSDMQEWCNWRLGMVRAQPERCYDG